MAAGMLNPLHITTSDGTLTVGVGLTVILYVELFPTQLFAVGVTVIVADIGLVPVLVAVNDGMLPEPLAAKPIAVLEFVQVKVAPGVTLVKVLAGTTPLLQTVILAGTDTAGIGCIVMLYGVGKLTQLLTVAVTVMVVYVGKLPLLIAVNEGTSPVPLAANPTEVFEFVHVNVPPAGVLVKFVAGITALLQTIIGAGTVTVGTGFVVMVYVPVAWQLFASVTVTL